METLRIIDKYGQDRLWDVTDERCVGCCWHAIFKDNVHCCPHFVKCDAIKPDSV